MCSVKLTILSLGFKRSCPTKKSLRVLQYLRFLELEIYIEIVEQWTEPDTCFFIYQKHVFQLSNNKQICDVYHNNNKLITPTATQRKDKADKQVIYVCSVHQSLKQIMLIDKVSLER